MNIFEKAARTILQNCLNIQPNETLLLVTDGGNREFADSIIVECHKLKIEAATLEIAVSEDFLQEPANFLGEIMAQVDVIILLTKFPLTRTRVCQFACSKNTRIISLINSQPETLKRIVETKYSSLESVTQKLADILTIGRNLVLTSEAGTDFKMSIAKLKGFGNTGIITQPGKISSIPAGEAYISLSNNSGEGFLVIDGSMELLGVLKEPLKLKIANGEIKRITGMEEASSLRRQIKRFGSEARQIIGFGIGTNDSARLGNSVDEDKIVLGTVHVSFGNTYFFDKSGRLPNRIDAILKNPTLTIDGKKILENGELMLMYH